MKFELIDLSEREGPNAAVYFRLKRWKKVKKIQEIKLKHTAWQETTGDINRHCDKD